MMYVCRKKMILHSWIKLKIQPDLRLYNTNKPRIIIIDGIDMFVERAEDPEYAKEKNLPLDVDYYIYKQILPPVVRILADFGEHGNRLKALLEKSPSEKQYDWCELAKETYEKIRDILKRDGKMDDAVNLVKSTIGSINKFDSKKNPELFNKFIITKRFVKKAENSKSKQPFMAVIEKMKNRGKIANEGDKIPYVILSGNGSEFERAEHPEYAKEKNYDLDVEYYIDKQILLMVKEKFSEYPEFWKKIKVIREQMAQKGQRSLFEFSE